MYASTQTHRTLPTLVDTHSHAHTRPTKQRHATPGEERSVNNMSEDVDTNTTIQYRAPEQADLYSRKRVDERVDNWALGVFLYKLLFFDDAFGESSLAIVSGKYSIPVQHSYV